MSHLHERKEKTCLNCGAHLIGRYCQDCGQENLEPKESVWHLVVHFFNDVTHFDGKLFSTLKYLIARPGFLTRAYINGKRASYLNPIRMYLFISAVFFLIVMTFFAPHYHPESHKEVQYADTLGKITLVRGDSVIVYDTLHHDTTIHIKYAARPVIQGDTLPETIRAYDSIQHALPPNRRHNFIKHFIIRRIVAIKQFSKENEAVYEYQVLGKFFHSLPYMLFVSLPLITFLLWLIYIRRRKEFFFVSHGIFLIHYYCVVFILLLIQFIASECGTVGDYVSNIALIGMFAYLLIAMKRFYHQGWVKTFLKFLLFSFFGFFLLIVLALMFFVNSLITAPI